MTETLAGRAVSFVRWYVGEVVALLLAVLVTLALGVILLVAWDTAFLADPFGAMEKYFWCEATVYYEGGRIERHEGPCDTVKRLLKHAEEGWQRTSLSTRPADWWGGTQAVGMLAVLGVQVPLLLATVPWWRRLRAALRRPGWRALALAVPAMLFAEAWFLAAQWLFPGVRQVADQMAFFFRSALSPPPAFAIAVGVAPVVEELYFRGRLYGGLVERFPPWFAIALTATLFALVHGLSPWALAGWFGAGLALGWLRWKSDGLVVPIAAHMATNAIAVGAIYYG